MFQINVLVKTKTHISRSATFFPPEIRAVYEIMWKKYGAKEVTDDNILGRMRFAGRISKTTRALADAHVHAPAHPHTHRHAHAQTRTHREICITYCSSTATMVS